MPKLVSARQRAYAAVAYAKQKGELVPEPCAACGAEPTEAHHEDWDRPLEVVWLCRAHHAALHEEKRLKGASAWRQWLGRMRRQSRLAPESITVSVPTSMEAMKRELILATLARTGGNKTRAAEMLGIGLRTLRNKLEAYGVQPE